MIYNLKNFFITCTQKHYARCYRVFVLIGTVIFVFIALPLVYLYAGQLIAALIPITTPYRLRIFFAVITLPIGITLIIWTLYTQYAIGGGSGSHIIPPSRLITSGIYRYCRHPMQLGAIIYYFGIGTLLGSLTSGLFGALITYFVGLWFHKKIEEKILEQRFGDEYRAYKKRTPPLIPLFMRVCEHQSEQ